MMGRGTGILKRGATVYPRGGMRLSYEPNKSDGSVAIMTKKFYTTRLSFADLRRDPRFNDHQEDPRGLVQNRESEFEKCKGHPDECYGDNCRDCDYYGNCRYIKISDPFKTSEENQFSLRRMK